MEGEIGRRKPDGFAVMVDREGIELVIAEDAGQAPMIAGVFQVSQGSGKLDRGLIFPPLLEMD
jgi:hypothetical protein